MAPTPDHMALHAAAEPSRTNWAGNFLFNAQHFTEPAGVEAVQDLVRSRGRVKAVGSRHSFNHIADTPDTQLALSRMKSMALHEGRRCVTVGAGVTYGELAPWLDARGFAVHNMASLPHISVVGACATGTHGSGIRNKCLSAAVEGMRGVAGTGEIFTLWRSENDAALRLAAVGLGAFGIITEITLSLLPSFPMAQMVYENLSFDQLQHSLREIFSAGYSVSLFTDWQDHRATQAWVKRKLHDSDAGDFAPTFYGATMQRSKLHPLPGLPAEHCTEQEGLPGRWYERLPHFRLDYTPSAGAELQTEYFVPLEHGYEAVLAVEKLRDLISPHLIVSELRVIAADDLPMSMCFRRESLAFHFTWKQEIDAVRAVLPHIEAALQPFAARPHWAKLFTLSPASLRAFTPRIDDFKQLVSTFDPEGKFTNEFLSELIYT